MTQHTETATPMTLMDERLIDYTKRMFREACTAWSDIRDKNGIIHEDKCQYASAMEGYAKGAIDRWQAENDTLRTQLAQAHISEEGTVCANCHNPSHALIDQDRDRLRAELAQAQNEALFPWKQPALRDWAICGMNHYHMEGVRYLFVSMVKDGRCITAEGANGDDALWNRLRDQALKSQERLAKSIVDDIHLRALLVLAVLCVGVVAGIALGRLFG